MKTLLRGVVLHDAQHCVSGMISRRIGGISPPQDSHDLGIAGHVSMPLGLPSGSRLCLAAAMRSAGPLTPVANGFGVVVVPNLLANEQTQLNSPKAVSEFRSEIVCFQKSKHDTLSMPLSGNK
jgi:hypothetical protein